MTTPLLMKRSGECDATILTDYLTNRNSNMVFIFYEGKDDPKFYHQHIRIFLKKCSKRYKNFICNGKTSVLRLQKQIKKMQVEGEVTLFFVDKDYDMNNNIDKDIFITPTYSIENLYFTDEALEALLVCEMGISFEDENDKKDLKIALDFLKSKRSQIVDEIIYGCACYSLGLKKIMENGLEEKGLCELKTYNNIRMIRNMTDFNQRMESCKLDDANEVDIECNRLQSSPERLIRGKYFLEKMPSYINEIGSEISKKENSQFSKNRKFRVNTSALTLLQDLSSYAELPKELLEYLEVKFRDVTQESEKIGG